MELERICAVCEGKGHVSQEDVDRIEKSIKEEAPMARTMGSIFGSFGNLKEHVEKSIKNAENILEYAKENVGAPCMECNMSGVILTEEGRQLLEFFKKYKDQIDIG